MVQGMYTTSKISFVCVTVKIFDSECKQIIRSVALKPRDKSSKQGGNGKQVTNSV